MAELGSNNYVNLPCPYCDSINGAPPMTSNEISFIGQVDNHDNAPGRNTYFYLATCCVCYKATIYAKKVNISEVVMQKRIYPVELVNPSLPKASKYMPDDIKEIYNEAAKVFDLSLRSAGALLRVALEKMLKKYVDKDDSLNNMIGQVSKDVPEYVSNLMDIIRTSGNAELHGSSRKETSFRELSNDETIGHVEYLFKFLNVISQSMGVLKDANKIFNELPENQKKQIENRNAKFKNE